MKQDREAIYKIISRMIENPGENGIYPTSTAYTALEHYIEGQRMQAIGWMHAEACHMLDSDQNPRTVDVPFIIGRAIRDLGGDND